MALLAVWLKNQWMQLQFYTGQPALHNSVTKLCNTKRLLLKCFGVSDTLYTCDIGFNSSWCLIERKWIINLKEFSMNRMIWSDLLKKPGEYTYWGCDFLISFESFPSDVFNCTSIGIVTTSVPFHLRFSLSSLRDRRGKLLYFSGSE